MKELVGKNRTAGSGRNQGCHVSHGGRKCIRAAIDTFETAPAKTLLMKVVEICIFTDVTEMKCKSHHQLM